jgi:hypothetical protein
VIAVVPSLSQCSIVTNSRMPFEQNCLSAHPSTSTLYLRPSSAAMGDHSFKDLPRVVDEDQCSDMAGLAMIRARRRSTLTASVIRAPAGFDWKERYLVCCLFGLVTGYLGCKWVLLIRSLMNASFIECMLVHRSVCLRRL